VRISRRLVRADHDSGGGDLAVGELQPRGPRCDAASPREPADRRIRVAVIAAYGAAALAFGYAAVSLYWAAGGTALLATVGGSI
jgi:hypothetical protein